MKQIKLITEKCKKCDRILKSTSKGHLKYIMEQHLLFAHPIHIRRRKEVKKEGGDVYETS